ncbi:MAG: SpoVA/SpoVAEb family sporulation membrane protein, partial [Clostridia bacterium]|nr:SpoVA/SpoVAEb family sporulation membrane protein [Clostridia bacterium]
MGPKTVRSKVGIRQAPGRGVTRENSVPEDAGMIKPLDDQLRQQQQQSDQAAYQQLVNQVKPKPPVARNSLGAFLVGGAICTLGQAITLLFLRSGLSLADAGSATVMVMVFLGALL